MTDWLRIVHLSAVVVGAMLAMLSSGIGEDRHRESLSDRIFDSVCFGLSVLTILWGAGAI